MTCGIRRESSTGRIFDAVVDFFRANLFDRLLGNVHARRVDTSSVENRVVYEVDAHSFRIATEFALGGLSKRELGLTHIVAKSIEAKKCQLVPKIVGMTYCRCKQTRRRDDRRSRAAGRRVRPHS